MTALGIFGVLLWTHVIAIAGGFSSSKPDVPRDCEPYNVGRIECGSLSGGNPAPNAPKSHVKTEAEGLAEWIREAQDKAPQ